MNEVQFQGEMLEFKRKKVKIEVYKGGTDNTVLNKAGWVRVEENER